MPITPLSSFLIEWMMAVAVVAVAVVIPTVAAGVVVTMVVVVVELLFEAYKSLAYKYYQSQSIEIENQYMNHTIHKRIQHKPLEEHEAREARTSNY